MSPKPQTIDEYLARLSKEKRVALEKLRRAIKAAAPKTEECISYGLAAFRLNGKFLVAFGAAANHCAFYPGFFPRRNPQGRTQGLRYQQGHHSFSSGQSLAGHTGAEAGEDSDHATGGSKTGCSGRHYESEDEACTGSATLNHFASGFVDFFKSDFQPAIELAGSGRSDPLQEVKPVFGSGFLPDRFVNQGERTG